MLWPVFRFGMNVWLFLKPRSQRNYFSALMLPDFRNSMAFDGRAPDSMLNTPDKIFFG